MSAVYKSFYDKADINPFEFFTKAACGLTTNEQNELVLPLSIAEQRNFNVTASALLSSWATAPVSPTSPTLNTSSAYKVVRDFHIAACKVGHGRSVHAG